MIKTKVTYLNKSIVVEEDEPSTIPEMTMMLGEDFFVFNAIANLRYRNKYPRVYKRVSVELEKQGFKKDSKDDMDHIRAVWAESDMNKPVIIELFKRIANEEPLYVKGERIGGGRVAQGALDAAHRYFAEGPEEVARVRDKIEDMLPSYRVGRDIDGSITPETLARGIQTLQRHLLSQAKQTTNNL